MLNDAIEYKNNILKKVVLIITASIFLGLSYIIILVCAVKIISNLLGMPWPSIGIIIAIMHVFISIILIYISNRSTTKPTNYIKKNEK